MKSASGRDRQEGGALQHRQRWTVLVTNSKKKVDSSATNTQAHRNTLQPLDLPTNSDREVKSSDEVSLRTGRVGHTAAKLEGDRSAISRTKCFSPPVTEPPTVVKEIEDFGKTGRKASYDSISLGKTGSGNVSSAGSSQSISSSYPGGISHSVSSGRDSDWSTPRMGSPNQETIPTSCNDVSGVQPPTYRHRFLSIPSDDTISRDSPQNTLPYSIRVDFGLSVHDSLHVPQENDKSMLSNAIDNLLKVTGNDEMSAQKVERHVMEQTMMLRAKKSSAGQFDFGREPKVVPSSSGQSEKPSVPPDVVASTTKVGTTREEDQLSVGKDAPINQVGMISSLSSVQDHLPLRPPSVRSLPTVHTAEDVVGSSCHCPHCCSCGSPRKKFNLLSRHRANLSGLHQRSPSIQSVPVYFPSMDGLDSSRAQGCPLQRFSRPSTITELAPKYHGRSSSVGPSSVRGSVKEIAHNFEILAACHNVSGSRLSLGSSVEGKSPYGRLHHACEHRRSPSIVSTRIPEEMGCGVAEQYSTASSERMDGSLLSLSSIHTSTSITDGGHSTCHGAHSMKVGVDGSVFKDRMNTLWSWFRDFSDQQRNILLSRILDWCNSSQMHHLSLQMEPILHQQCPHNCQDLLSWLPSHISLHILSYLDPVSLCSCRLVSRNWCRLVSRDQLWKRLCLLEKYQLSPQGQKKQLEMHTHWMDMFAERYRLWRNWSRGYCNIRTFEGHTQGVSCVQFDDNRIVSGSSDKTIKVWNIRTNTTWAALTLEGHSGDVRCLHLHGNRLVSGSSDRTIKVWELFTENRKWLGATCRVTMVGHHHTVRCLQSDDERVISGSYDHTLKIWNIKTGECTHTLRGHTDHVLCLQFKDGILVSGSGDCTIIVWDMTLYQMKRTLRGHKAAVTTLQFDQSRIISGSLDRLIKIWDYTSGQCVCTLDWIHSEGHTGVIRHLQADHLKMVSAADDRTLKVWSLDSGERLLTLRSHTDGVTCVQFNDCVIVSGSYDKTVKLWDFSAC